jgi:hypothetical protein
MAILRPAGLTASRVAEHARRNEALVLGPTRAPAASRVGIERFQKRRWAGRRGPSGGDPSKPLRP